MNQHSLSAGTIGSSFYSYSPIFRILSLVAAIILGFTGCAKHQDGPPASSMSARRGPTTLATGDTVRLTFRKTPELNQVQRIRSDGKMNLLQVGTVKAAGKSLDAFQSELVTRYELKTPTDLNVSLDSTDAVVYVTGAVASAGKVRLDRPLTVLEVIMECGGFDRSSANLKKVSLTRMVNGKYVTTYMDMRGQPEAVYVQPYDMIEVARFFH